MRIRGGQDFATGCCSSALASSRFGSAPTIRWVRRTPRHRVLPRILAWCLIATGGLLWIKALLADGPGLTRWAWRPVIMVTLATIAFAAAGRSPRAGGGNARLDDADRAGHTRRRAGANMPLFAVLMLVIGIGMFI